MLGFKTPSDVLLLPSGTTTSQLGPPLLMLSSGDGTPKERCEFQQFCCAELVNEAEVE